MMPFVRNIKKIVRSKITQNFILKFKKNKMFSNTLKKFLLLKIENNSSEVNFTHFREKTHLPALGLIFVSSSW